MKISKIFAGMSALAIVAAMAVTASAETPKTASEINPCVKPWSGTSAVAKDWDTSTRWNGGWVQFYTTNDDFASDTITFTIDTTGATWEESENEETGEMETLYSVGNYTVLRAFNTAAANQESGKYEGIFVDGVATGDFAATDDNGVLTLTITGEQFQAAIDAGDCTPSEVADDDGNVYAYNVGFNIQCGHYDNAKLTCTISGDNLIETTFDEDGNIVAVMTEEDAETPADTTDEPADTTDEPADTTDEPADTTDEPAETTETPADTTTDEGSTGTTTGTTTAASDNVDNSATGATAGLALAGIALAGAAIIATKRK